MLRLAGRACPEAELILGDMTRLTLPGRYDGLVAWDSVFHVPRARHAALFADMHRWLRPHAPLLLSLGGSHDEFVAPMFGVGFFFSGHAPAVGLRLLQESGFEILLAEMDDPSSRGHLAVLGRRTRASPP